MDQTSKAPLRNVALSAHLTPSVPSQWDARDQQSDSALASAPLRWSHYRETLSSIVAGHDRALLDNALATAKSIWRGEAPGLARAIVEGLVRPSAFTLDKVLWLEGQGQDVRPTLQVGEDDIKSWATAKDDAAFDWALAPVAGMPDSEARDRVLSLWLGEVINGFASRESDSTATALWVSRRVHAIEAARPGIVREWLSTIPKYGSSETDEKLIKHRDQLRACFSRLLVAACPEVLADWLDPGCFGHPTCAHILMESAMEESIKNDRELNRTREVLGNLSRALAVRPAAQEFWNRQSRPGHLVPTDANNRVWSSVFPGQNHAFGRQRFGKQGGYGYGGSGRDTPKDRDDAKLPLDPLGRLLATRNDGYVDHVARQPGGRAQIIECMKSHPAFMAYGFSRFGEDLLRWDEASAMDGFRDKDGYGAARYLLSLSTPVASTFDVMLHRCLRQRKAICDDAEPSLLGLFVDPTNRAKFMAMELKKVSKEAVSSVPRPSAPPSKRRGM